MSSLSDHERIGLDDVFLSLGEKQALTDRVKEQQKRLLTTLSQIARKGVPLVLSYVKSKNIMFHEHSKRDNFKLFNHFRPKNRGSK